ncbi:MAG: hypothetical protein KFF68_12930 [Desulfosarcina sp.]|nr:hypothetical protein [Desulfosarcina sp.]
MGLLCASRKVRRLPLNLPDKGGNQHAPSRQNYAAVHHDGNGFYTAVTTNNYAQRLAKHRAVIIAAMKVKQNADQKYEVELKETIEAISSFYPQHKHESPESQHDNLIQQGRF